MWVGGGLGRGLFYVVVFNAILFNSELNTKSFSCQTNKILEEYFNRQHFWREYFHIAYYK